MFKKLAGILSAINLLKAQARQLINEEEDHANQEKFKKECDAAIESGDLDNVRKLLFD